MLCQARRQSIGVRKRHSTQNVCATFHRQGILVSTQLASTSETSVITHNSDTMRRTFTTWDDGDGRAVVDDTLHRMACDLAITSR